MQVADAEALMPGVAGYAAGLVLAFDDHDAARAGVAQGGGGGEPGRPAADDRDIDAVGGDVVRGGAHARRSQSWPTVTVECSASAPATCAPQ